MVERFVEAVLEDGVPVGSILALTFTEKAAGELRERVRRRLLELGEDEHARAVDARLDRHDPRLLRPRAARAPAGRRAGPALRRCSTRPAAGRLAAARLRARAGRRGRRRSARPAVDLAAAYAHEPARPDPRRARRRCAAAARPSRGCRSRPSAAAPTPARARRRPRAAAAALLAGAGAGKRVERGPRRAGRVRAAARAAGRPGRRCPGELDAREARRRGEGARRRRVRGVPRAPGRPTGRRCADHHARAALVLLDDLLARFGAELRRGQGRARRAWTSRTSSSASATCSPTTGERAPLERALRADHGRRVPGHQPAPAGPAGGAGARQPVRGRRRVPVDLPLPPRRRAHLPRAPRAAGRGRACAGWRPTSAPPRSCWTCSTPPSRRARRALPAAAWPAASRAAPTRTASCGCSIPTRRPASRPSSCSSPTRAAGTSGAAARPRRARRPAVAPRRGARCVAHRLREEVDAGRRPATSSCSCAPPRRCGCSSRRSRSRACRPTSSAAAATGRRSRSATASPTSPRSPTRATRSRCYGVLASPFCGVGSDALVAARRGRPRRRPRAVGRAARRRRRPGAAPTWLAALADGRPRAAAARSRASSPPSARAAERLAGRDAARAGDRGAPATTSRSSPGPAASGGWRTCAS